MRVYKLMHMNKYVGNYIYDDRSEKVLDFKDDNLTDNVLKISRESKDLIINEDNQEFWKKYHNINRIRFYSTIKFLFSKRLFRLLYSFIVIKEKAKGG